jgi:fatty acid desaturase
VSTRHGWLNLLILNFGYHNAHHQRASVPWYRLPSFHRQLYGDGHLAVMPMRELLRSWHRNRVRRVSADDYGAPQAGASQAGSPQGDAPRRADGFVGAHGVSFLTVV